MIIKNESGAALVVILILLVTGALLIGSLFVVSQSHINSAVREEGNSKAFYYSDAGVEFVKSSSNNDKINLTQISSEEKYLVYDESESSSIPFKFEKEIDIEEQQKFITASDLLGSAENSSLKFSIKAEKDGGIYKFNSTGYSYINNKEFKKNITFNLRSGLGSSNKIFNILEKEPGNVEMKSKASELNEDMALKSTNILPTLEYWKNLMNNADNLSDVIANNPGNGNNQGGGNNSSNGNSSESYDDIFVKSSGDVTFQGITFKNSILIIDGDLTLKPHNSFENTIVIINGDFKVNGAPNFEVDNTLFFIYNAEEVHIAGNPKNIKPEIDFSKLPIDLTEEGINPSNLRITNWNEN